MAATASKHQYNSIQELGGLFVELDQAYQNADYEPLFQEEIPRMEAFHESVFANEHSPGGEHWPELAPRTIREKGHDVILHRTGRLGSSLFGQTGDSVRATSHRGMLFGTSVEYSIFHTEGGSRLPRREHVGLNEQYVDELANRVADATVEKLKG